MVWSKINRLQEKVGVSDNTMCGLQQDTFCAMPYVNDKRYLPNDEVPGIEHLRCMLKNKREICRKWSLNGSVDLQFHSNPALPEFQNIDIREGLYFDSMTLYSLKILISKTFLIFLTGNV